MPRGHVRIAPAHPDLVIFQAGVRTRRHAQPVHDICRRERAAVAASAGAVLLFDPRGSADQHSSCPARPIVQANLTHAVMHKAERLRSKLELLRHRSLRAKLGSFLLLEMQRRGQRSFTVPLSRAELAEYLHADRAAVSRELARMRRDGLIDFTHSSFVLRELDKAVLDQA